MGKEECKDERTNTLEVIFVTEVFNVTLDKTTIMINMRYYQTEDILNRLAFILPDNFNEDYH